MTLVELVNYFRNGGSFKKFCQLQSLDPASEVVEIYMQKPFDIGNRLEFFEIEKTKGMIECFNNGIQYFNLFDFDYFLDAMEESNISANSSFTDNAISRRLYDYAIDDA